MPVPKMVKNGFNSVLQTSAVREGWLPQGIQEQCEAQNCPQITKGE